MILFILFNQFCMSTEQWKKHPYQNKKTGFLNKLKKIGDIYIYNPIFYNFNQFNNGIVNKKYNTKYNFTIKSLDLEKHCEDVYNDVMEKYDEFVLISHSTGYIIAHKFAELYEKNVKGIINIDGGNTKEWYKMELGKNEMRFFKKVKDKQLKSLFLNLKNNVQVNESIRVLEKVVRYNLFKQYTKLKNQYSCPIYIFNNVDSKNELDMLDKFKYNNDFCEKNNARSFYYINKSDFLYIDIDKQIINCINNFV
jgi:hypothetical protein